MTTIAEVRQKYPQYKDLSDEQLAQGLHAKFYADLPYDQFAQKIGLTSPKSEQPPAKESLTLPANAGLANFAATTLGLPVDTIEGALNLADRVRRLVAGKTNEALYGGDPLRKSVGGSEWIKEQLRKTGEPGLSPDNPQPNSEVGKLQYDLTSRGGFIPGGAAPAIGSIIAEKTLGPEWAPVGAMAPGAAVQAVSAAKTAVANPKTIQQNLETFKAAGTAPDVAQATESNFFRGLTNVVARVPGGQGVISKFRELEQRALGKAASTGVSAESGGRAIKRGITGEGGFLDRTKETWLNLDDEVAAKIPKGTTFAPANTVKALKDLTSKTPGAEKTTGALVNPKIAEIKKNLAADLAKNNGQLPFDALRALRARVGSMLDDSLVSGIPNGELKRLYGGLSKDLEGAAQEAGAGAQFARQQNYYKARMERIENTLDKVLGMGKDPEAIFKSVAPSDADSVNKIRRVMRSLSSEDRQIVSQAVVNRLGRASPGRQDEAGNIFSSETFLTNWNRINDSAKSQLFPNHDVRTKLDAIAKVSADIRAGKAVFANNSGTTQGIAAASIYGSPIVSLATGTQAPIVVAGSMVVGANIGARMLTSPKTVDLLAKSAKVTTDQQRLAQLSRLAVIFNETKDEELKKELSDYINSIGK